MKQIKPNIGEKYGRLTLIKIIGTRLKTCNCLWKCECGNLKEARLNAVRRGRIQSCGCLRYEYVMKMANKLKLPIGEAAFNKLFNNYGRSAKKHNRTFLLNKDEFRFLTKQLCFYCKDPPYNISKNHDLNGEYIYNGIDRIDNNIGYEIKNCVTCCKICNKMKGTLTHDEFINHIRKVNNNFLLAGNEMLENNEKNIKQVKDQFKQC